MLVPMFRIVCENCHTWLTLNTGDSLEAGRMAAKRGWVELRHDMYGNVSHFCNSECRAVVAKQLYGDGCEIDEQGVPTGSASRTA